MLLRAATLLLLVGCSLLGTPRVSAAPTDEPITTRISDSEECPVGCMCMKDPQSEAPGMMDVVCPTAGEIKALEEDPPVDVSVMDAIDFVESFPSKDKTPEDIQKLNVDDSVPQDASVELKPMPIELKEESSTSLQADESKIDTAVNDVNNVVLKSIDEEDQLSSEEEDTAKEDESDSDSDSVVSVSLSFDPVTEISKEQTLSVTVQLPTEGPSVLISLDDNVMQGDQPQSDDEEDYDDGEAGEEEEQEEAPAGNEEVAETLIGDSDAKIVPKKEAPIHFDEEQTITNLPDSIVKPDEEENDINSQEDSLQDPPLLPSEDKPASSSETEDAEVVDPKIGVEEVPTQIIISGTDSIADVTAVPIEVEEKLEDDLPTGDKNNPVGADSGEESSEKSDEDSVARDAPQVFSDPPAATSEPPQAASTDAAEPTEVIINSNPVVEESNHSGGEGDSGEEPEETATILSRIRQFEAEQQLLGPAGDPVLLPDGEILNEEQMDEAKSGKMTSEDEEATTQPQQSTASWVILGLILTTFFSVLGYAAIRGRMDKRSEDRKAKSKAAKAASSTKPSVVDSKVNRKPGIEGTEMKVLTHPLLQTRDEENVREFKDNKENNDLQKVVVADSNAVPYIDAAPNAGQKLVKPPRKIGHAPLPPPPITIPTAPEATMNRSNPAAPMSPTSPNAPSPTTPTLVRTRMVEHSPQVGRVTHNVVGNPFDE